MTLASAGWDSTSTIRLWDVATGVQVRLIDENTDMVLSVTYSPDGLTFASGSQDGAIRLWDATTGARRRTLQGHSSNITSLAFSPDGLKLASGSRDRTVSLWDANRDVLVRTLKGHTSWVESVAFSPNGRMLASGASDDDTVHLWDTATGDLLGTFKGHSSEVTGVAFHPDGIGLASGSLDGTILFWDTTPYTNPGEFGVTDVNRDGITNILDLVLVASHFGKLRQDGADVNGDGVANLKDLELVADALGDAAAPSSHAGGRGALTAEDVKKWLNDAKQLETADPTVQRGIITLERLLTALTRQTYIPTETALLPNYPNPFNPETSIPYQLKEAADIRLTVYDVHGQVVRTLAAGFQSAGVYRNRDRAAYWDGRNERGEPVATGVYFCTLSAGDFSTTRRMLVGK